MKNIKIGNIEYQEVKYGNNRYEEIIKWYPNKYYNSQESMKKDGWIFDDDGSAHKDSFTVDSSMFKNEFNQCVIAYVEWNRAHDEFNIKSVGTRAFELDKENEKDFKTILRLIEETNNYENSITEENY